jgi:hypothetical protein
MSLLKTPLDTHQQTWEGAIPNRGNHIFPEDDGTLQNKAP